MAPFRECIPAALAQTSLVLSIELRQVRAGRAYARGEGLPPFVEARMLDAHREHGLLNVLQPRFPEELGEVASSSAGQLGLVVDLRVELTGRLPEPSQRSLAACVIPYTRCDNAARSGHAGHLGESSDR